MKQVIFFLALIALAGGAQAKDPSWFLQVNGASHHFNRPTANEENWGVGLGYEWDSKLFSWDARAFCAGGGLIDSRENLQLHAGCGQRYTLTNIAGVDLGFGVVAGFIHSEDVWDGKPFPALGPFLWAGGDWGRVNLAVVPPIGDKGDFIFLNLEVDLGFILNAGS